MNNIIAMQIATRQRMDKRENITRIDKRMILRTLRTRIKTPKTAITDTDILLIHHTQTANRATPNPNFMLSGK